MMESESYLYHLPFHYFREAENDGMGGGIGKTQCYFPKKEVGLRNIHFGNLLILIVNMRLML